MAKNILGLIAIVMIAGTVGCSICCGPDDYNYGTYGGIHQRSDMQHGRVGSVFSDPNGTAIKLTPHGEVSESVTPEVEKIPSQGDPQKNNLPDPNQKNDNGGSGAKDVDTRYYQPSRYRRPSRSNRGSRSNRSSGRTASLLGGRRYN